MSQLPLIKEIINHPIEGKEQFYSHWANNEFRLFSNGTRYIYAKMDFYDGNVYVSSSDGILTEIDNVFLLDYFKFWDFIITNCTGSKIYKLSKAFQVEIAAEIVNYDAVILQ